MNRQRCPPPTDQPLWTVTAFIRSGGFRLVAAEAARGTLLALLGWAAVLWDPRAEWRGLPTVSAWLLWRAQDRSWIAAVRGAIAGLLVGVLIGHRWSPQTR
jgi:hypothetical protein